MNFDSFLNPVTMALMIPMLAILAGVVGMVIRHRERMAMIERGMNPDQGKLDGGNKTEIRR